MVKAGSEPKANRITIAYFSMEVGLEQEIPTYSGGLGILAGDTLKSCADLHLPVVGVTLLSAKGYFIQKLDEEGNQTELPVEWDPSDQMELLPHRCVLEIEGRPVSICAWRYWVAGQEGGRAPVYFVDTNLKENAPQDRDITSFLYGGDEEYRLKQEAILGIGGVRMLRALGYTGITTFHMNEGHASLLTLELLRETEKRPEEVWIEEARWNPDAVRDLCVFTTHTPVPAGHDRFSYPLVKKILGKRSSTADPYTDSWLINDLPFRIVQTLSGEEDFHMTLLALNLSRYTNGVAKKHGEVSKTLFPGREIDAITNGIHVHTWTSPEFRDLFDRHFQGWARDSFLLRHAFSIPKNALWEAHQSCKRRLSDFIRERTGKEFDPGVLTIGFARRATTYKRADLLFRDPKRLAAIVKRAGKIQIVFAGKAHPRDEPGKELIRTIVRHLKTLEDIIPGVYLENYDIALGGLLTSGVDVWLNTPLRPREASGTSGMKATLNGVLNFSVLDGWWIEGHREGITGWAIGPDPTEKGLSGANDEADANDLYQKLENVILRTYYGDLQLWIEMMRNALSLNGSFFSTNRMMLQYVSSAYLPKSI